MNESVKERKEKREVRGKKKIKIKGEVSITCKRIKRKKEHKNQYLKENKTYRRRQRQSVLMGEGRGG